MEDAIFLRYCWIVFSFQLSNWSIFQRASMLLFFIISHPFRRQLYVWDAHSVFLQLSLSNLACKMVLLMLAPVPIFSIKMTQLERFLSFFVLVHIVQSLQMCDIGTFSIAVFAYSRDTWKECILRMTKHQSGCTWAVSRGIILLEDGRNVWVMVMTNGLSSNLGSSLTQLIKIQMRNLSYADWDLLISLSLNYSKEKSRVSVIITPVWLHSIILGKFNFASLEQKSASPSPSFSLPWACLGRYSYLIWSFEALLW